MIGYDFDKTIYDGDSFMDFYKYCLLKRAYLLLYLPFQLCLLLLTCYSRKYMKQTFASYLLFIGKKEKLIEGFWNKNMSKVKDFYFRQKRDDDIIISASPSFLLIPICKRIGIKNCIATNMDVRTGIIKGKNCRGMQKVIEFKKAFPEDSLLAYFGDSKSDLYMISFAKYGYYVKGHYITQIKW